MESAKAAGLFGRLRRAADRPMSDSARGMGWAAATQMAGTVVRFGSSLTLAHLLDPTVYGLFAPVLAVQFVIELAADLGIRPAVVSNPRGGEPAFLATAWSMILGRSVLVALAIGVASMLLPGLLGQPLIGPMIAVMAVRPLVQALANPSLMLLYRRMQYRPIGMIELGQTAVSACVTVGLAWLGDVRTAWAFVGGILAGDLTMVLLSHLVAPRPPRPGWDRAAAREIGRVGTAVYFNTLAMALWLYADRLLGLKLTDGEAVGLYTVAWGLIEVADRVATRWGEVELSDLARQPDAAARLELTRRTAERVVHTMMPVMALLVALTPWVLLIYPAKFGAIRWLCAVLAARTMVRCLGVFQSQYLLAAGRIRLMTGCYALGIVVQLGLLAWLAPRLGAEGLALAMLGSTWLLTLAENLVLWRMGATGLRPFALATFWAGVGLLAAWGGLRATGFWG